MWELKKKSQILVRGTLGSNPLSAPKSKLLNSENKIYG